MKFLNTIDGADKVVTSDAQQFISKAEKDKLTGIQAGALNNPHPATHPASMITGLPTSLPADGGNALSASHLLGDDTRAVNSDPSAYMSSGSRWAGRAGWQTEFKNRTAINSPPLSGTYVYLQTHTPWSDPSGGYPIQIAYGNGIPCWRVGTSTTTWSAWQKVSDGGNADTVNGFTVGVNVPANAKFTDTNTITTINGKTGAISKVDIVALGIPSEDTNTTYTAGAGLTLTGTVFTPTFGTTAGTVTQGNDSRLSNARTPLPHNHTIGDLPTYPTSLPADGGNADTVGGFTVGVSVPANAKFTDTDTIYTHPTTAGNKHLPSGGNVGQILINTASGTATWQELPQTPLSSGSSTFAGNGSTRTIAHGLGVVPRFGYATPSVNPNGFLGEVWVSMDATNIIIGNSGSFSGAMSWVAIA